MAVMYHVSAETQDHLEEQLVPLTTEPPLQQPEVLYKCSVVWCPLMRRVSIFH